MRGFPRDLGRAAYQGLAGEFLRLVESETEASPPALLTQFLTLAGHWMGRRVVARLGEIEHRAVLFTVLVGVSSRGRKGTALHLAERPFAAFEGEEAIRVVSGLSSGEGLIAAVQNSPGGPAGKRVLAVQHEFASVLKVGGRQANTLSPTLRDAWDSRELEVLTRTNPLKAEDAHVSLVGHITPTEFVRELSETEAANGFGNRLLIVATRRSRRLPFGGDIPETAWSMLHERLQDVAEHLRKAEQTVVELDDSAKPLWEEFYRGLPDEAPGLYGALTSRSEPYVLRLALIYAVLDRRRRIEREHLEAALEVWRYADESARWVFSDRVGDEVADRILEALRQAGEKGLSMREIHGLFHNNQKRERLATALEQLRRMRMARMESRPSGRGRPTEQWFAV